VTDFTKYHALGNDYLVIHRELVAAGPAPGWVRLLCDRHFGVGADGVLLCPLQAGQLDRPQGRPVEVRVFNSDGGECERSGNGLRIFALHLARYHGYRGELQIRTLAGDTPVRLLAADPETGTATVSVAMGRPRVDALAEPVTIDGERLAVTRVHNGNPHAVVPVAEPSERLARRLGPLLTTSPHSPERTNVQFLQVVDRSRVRIEIWERGAGYTLASGNSACAAASAAHALGLVDGRVEVRMPGGAIDVETAADGAVTMTGPAEEVASGWFAPALLARLAGDEPAVALVPAAGTASTASAGAVTR
jgi:diaminopimelate epimerase